MTINSQTNVRKKHYILRLFVAGNATNSRIARENLDQLLAKHPEHEFEVEIVDLNLEPEVALEQGVFISPALQILEPNAGGVIYGNLSQMEVLEKVLNL
ncbi:MAG TPA: circadian clock KaiB family protein [Anaerolineales bacterium]|nr:circadian clock KaiB family protein [Anaerolineales bacterium]HMV97688.1 circadian clock KaiB family protein [Anaerolineales bacterium]HMX21169.1 circadian clock KaiB family protein [Anaerolineales bacterium]HND93906.1 circadian clock KaiB family protein [Anaerolineales bacterium]HNE69841.1 circadian clock KaiB family protein [Anaerolineales bacterium]